LLLAVTLAACSDSSIALASGAAVEGFLMQGSPLISVDDPANAPPGDVSVAGAEVRVRDSFGAVVGTATSGQDGKFVVELAR
jgi:hypothetical protein